MKGADYRVRRIRDNRTSWERRTGQTWKIGNPYWNYKKANVDMPMYLWVDQGLGEVGLQRKKPNRVTKQVIAVGTLGTLWETFMNYARML